MCDMNMSHVKVTLYHCIGNHSKPSALTQQPLIIACESVGQQFMVAHLGQARLILAGLTHVSAVTGGSAEGPPSHVEQLVSSSWGAGEPGHVSHPPEGHRACSRGSSRVHKGEGRL